MSGLPRPFCLIAPAALLLCGCAGTPELAANRVVVRGVLTFPSTQAPRLQDCASRRELRLGPMAHGSYLYLKRRAGELARRHRQPVTAEVSGYLRRSGAQLHVDRVAVLQLSPGHCTDLEDKSGDIDF